MLDDSDSGHAVIRRNRRGRQSAPPLIPLVQKLRKTGVRVQTNGHYLQEFLSQAYGAYAKPTMQYTEGPALQEESLNIQKHFHRMKATNISTKLS